MTLYHSAFKHFNMCLCVYSVFYVYIYVRGLDFFIPYVEPQIMLHLRYMKSLKDYAYASNMVSYAFHLPLLSNIYNFTV